jgi:hypothetical protein
MSTFEKRAREDKQRERTRAKEQRRNEKRLKVPREPQLVSASDIQGRLPSIEQVMASLQSGTTPMQRSAPTIPTKLFVGSLSEATTSSSLRAHFETFGNIAEAAVIMDRGSGASRGFGFVTMADRKDAPGAIAALHHSELDGNRIVVSVATER